MVEHEHPNGRGGSRPPAFEPFAAKFAVPTVSIPLVDRHRIVDALIGFPGAIVVLSAPAGYGKSTVAAQWLAADPRPGAWLSLDAGDNDPHVLLTYLALAVGQPEGHGLDADAELDDLLQVLRDVLAARTTPGLLVLDDAHLITDAASTQVLTTLAEHMPAGSTLAVLTREQPSIPIARAVLHGRAVVVQADVLAMTEDEAVALLRYTGVSEAQATADVLARITEGWPAGLYLAALALRDAADPVAAARGIRGRQRLITDFFVEEVLPALAGEEVDFLLETSILDRCSGELCDAVLGRTDSGDMLERLARTNRFVLPLDDAGEWYRYHHLFADMLQAEQRRRDAVRARTVAARASEWWEQQGDPDRAIAQARAAGDDARTIDLVCRYAPLLQNNRRTRTVDHWLEQFTDDDIMATPALAVTAAWNAQLAGDDRAVHRYTSAISSVPDPELLPDGTPPGAAAALLRALCTTDGLGTILHEATRAFDEHPVGSPYRPVAAVLQSSAHLALGNLDDAWERARTAVELGRTSLIAAVVQGLGCRARAEAFADDWEAARRSVDEAIVTLHRHWLDDSPGVAHMLAIASLTDARLGRVDRAREERELGEHLLARLHDVTPYQVTHGLLELAESAILTNDLSDGRRLLQEAERRLGRLRDTGLLPMALDRVAFELSLARARPAPALVEPLTPAEQRVLAYLPTHLSFGEIGEELFVSRNTVKSHAMAIYRKLGVTSRSAAVKEADHLGLLT